MIQNPIPLCPYFILKRLSRGFLITWKFFLQEQKGYSSGKLFSRKRVRRTYAKKEGLGMDPNQWVCWQFKKESIKCSSYL
jgi:hypothetical protein